MLPPERRLGRVLELIEDRKYFTLHSGRQTGKTTKLRRDSETLADALDQLAGYLDIGGLDAGWLVIFDLRREVSGQDKLTVQDVVHPGRAIRIFGC